MTGTSVQEDLESAVLELLEATEWLHAGVLGDDEARELDTFYERRERAYEALRSIAGQGGSPTAAARACLARVRVLDAEMLAAVDVRAGEIRGERHALARRRTAVQAHASRERGEPRLVTVKA